MLPTIYILQKIFLYKISLEINFFLQQQKIWLGNQDSCSLTQVESPKCRQHIAQKIPS